MAKKAGKSELGGILGGTLNILGFKIDLEELLESPENLEGRLAGLRERLKAAGLRETLSEEEWRQGNVSVSGYVRTRGALGKREFHVGTLGHQRGIGAERSGPAPETAEPPVDVFDEDGEVVIIADVPGVTLRDLDLRVSGNTFSLSTTLAAPRQYHKEVVVEQELEPASLRSSCRNGVLEVRVRKSGA